MLGQKFASHAYGLGRKMLDTLVPVGQKIHEFASNPLVKGAVIAGSTLVGAPAISLGYEAGLRGLQKSVEYGRSVQQALRSGEDLAKSVSGAVQAVKTSKLLEKAPQKITELMPRTRDTRIPIGMAPIRGNMGKIYS